MTVNSIHLEVLKNPKIGERVVSNYKVRDTFMIDNKKRHLDILIKFVPDKEITLSTHIKNWIVDLSTNEWENLEDLATVILAGFYDVVLPFYLELEIAMDNPDLIVNHNIKLSKAQPQFKVDEMLARLL